MAYDIFPKTEDDLRSRIRDYTPEIQGELVSLFRYLKKTHPRVDTPINLDSSKRTSVNITRMLQEDTSISTIKTAAKISKLAMKFGNGSSGNRGINNRGNNFESQYAFAIKQWWEGEPVTDTDFIASIESLDKTYGLKKQKALGIDLLVETVGEENTRRPLVYSPTIHITNTNGTGDNVGPTVTDITLTSGTNKIYLSLKLGTTVTFFNVGVRTVLSPEDIKAYSIKGDGKKLLALFGIDETLFCDVFNGKLLTGKSVTSSVDQTAMRRLLRSGIGYGYHIIHKLSGRILSKKMDEAALSTASAVSTATIYYGGKTGTGKRIDIEMESPTYKFKLNLRDTQGRDGYPTRLMCDFSYK